MSDDPAAESDPTLAAAMLASLHLPVYAVDTDGRLRFANAAAFALWGCRPPAGARPWPDPWRLLDPDGRVLAADEVPTARCLSAGRALRGLAVVAERPDGSRVALSASPTPLRDAEGRITGASDLLVPADLHGEADVDRARLAAIVASSSDAIVSKTLAGVVTSWNDAAQRIFGYAAEEMIGRPITRLIPPELRHEEVAILAKLARGERVAPFDTVRIAKDGRRIDVSLTISPLIDDGGRVVGASKVARDISERKRSDTVQRLLFHELNHRVKNMLATIQALVRQSLRRASDPESFATSVGGRIRALAIVHDLLVAEELRGADLGSLLRALLPVRDRVALDGPAVLLGPRATEQLGLVLHELAANAVEHGALSPSVGGGRLAVRWRVVDGRLTLEWAESGVPLPAADAAGRGFGRTLIQRGLVPVGGRAAMTDGPDGLEVRIDLPLEGVVEVGVAAAPAAPARGPCVLLVEDEPLVALDIETQLIGLGCRVVGPAASVETALALVEAGGLDAAFVDGNLGGRAVDPIAEALAGRAVPFAFVSGYGREALPASFASAPLLAKPFGPEQLAETLRALVPG